MAFIECKLLNEYEKELSNSYFTRILDRFVAVHYAAYMFSDCGPKYLEDRILLYRKSKELDLNINIYYIKSNLLKYTYIGIVADNEEILLKSIQRVKKLMVIS